MEVILLQVHQVKTIWATNLKLPTISIARAEISRHNSKMVFQKFYKKSKVKLNEVRKF